ncbi:hypothetical protein GTA08_BOTSDO02449 [Botryosphaeria dothidea]|uniref:Uncharacterized protein n=1 Tax=Botryosphaeria dothidea TaxID=55169 RepID=A0A8H4IX25_9PEZI|nr:hypothetical protein GTA08_BOTSDO02449 [Botryosphaeria dothidea]
MENSASLVVFSIIAVASGRPQRDTLPLFGRPQQPPSPQQYKINRGALTLPDMSSFPYSRCSDPQEHIDNGANPGDAPSFAGNLQGTCNHIELPGCRTLCNNERTLFKHLHMQARRQ